jgi:hypothetical protein
MGTEAIGVPAQRGSDVPLLAGQSSIGQAVPDQRVSGQSMVVPAQRIGPMAPAPAVARPKPPRRNLRPILAVLGGMLALLLLGGIGIAYVVYDRATAPDRSAPDVVVDNFLRAYFVERDESKALLFACSDTSQLREISAFREDLESRERRFNTSFTVTWGSLTPVERADSVDVLVDLRLFTVVDGFEQSDVQSWRFETRDQEGWRVCGAGRVG